MELVITSLHKHKMLGEESVTGLQDMTLDIWAELKDLAGPDFMC